jgi:hypothetical protein
MEAERADEVDLSANDVSVEMSSAERVVDEREEWCREDGRDGTKRSSWREGQHTVKGHFCWRTHVSATLIVLCLFGHGKLAAVVNDI